MLFNIGKIGNILFENYSISKSLRLPALGSADASFRVLIPLRAIPGAIDRGLVALFGEGLRYDIEGTAELGDLFRIPFRKNGRFTRTQLLAAIS